MEETPWLLTMPVELIHCISSYLPVDDVISFSQTCHYLRSALNYNCVWKRYLQSILFLESMEPYVQPVFKLDESLSHLCENRLRLMKKIHINNNWWEGRFVGLEDAVDYYNHFSGFLPQQTQYFCNKGRGQQIYDNEYFFMSARILNRIEIQIWNIRKEAVFHSVLPLDSLTMFQIVGSNLIVISCCKVSVYEITIPNKIFPLKYSFVVNNASVEYEDPANLRHLTPCVKSSWIHDLNGRFLISIKRNEHLFHVWDILDPSKLGTFEVPNKAGLRFKDHPTFLKKEALSVEAYFGNIFILRFCYENYYHFFGFDVTKKDFSKFEVYCNYYTHTIMFNTYVIMFKQGSFPYQCIVYDFETSAVLNKTDFYCTDKIRIAKGTLPLTWYKKYKIIDVNTLDVVHAGICQDESKKYFNFLGSPLVRISTENCVIGIWENLRQEILSKLVSKHPTIYICFVNDQCTNVVCVSDEYFDLDVLHFW